MFINVYSNRNRSLTGDTVAVQLLPKSDWKGTSRQLPTSHTPNLSPDDESRDNTRPTGRVVGILSRPTRDIVATFPVSISVSIINLALKIIIIAIQKTCFMNKIHASRD